MEDNMKVSIKFEGKEVEVTLKKLTWKDQNEATRMAMKGGTLDFVTLQEQKLVKSIADAPFPIQIESLWKLDASEGDKLFKAFNKFNGFTEESQKNLSSPSIQEN